MAALAAASAWAIMLAAARLEGGRVLLEAVVLKAMISLRGLAVAARTVIAHLNRGDVIGARAAVGYHLVSRRTSELDESQVASAAIESVAENLTDALVAPLLWYLALGLPGAVAYRVVNTADAMIGYRESALEHFGKVAARLDDLLNLIPARLAALALIAAAGLTGGSFRQAARVMWRDHGRTASPNAGWTMAAMAGALRVVLEKPGHYRLGEGRRPASPDVRRSIRLTAVGALLTTALIVLILSLIY